MQIAAAHDGEAELIVALAHANGGESVVALDEYAVRTLMAGTGANQPEGLIGASWVQVRDALIASSNRFAAT